MKNMSALSVTVNGIEFPNPLILASGILDETAESMRRMEQSGAGGVVTKSIGLKPREGHPNPTFHVLEEGLMNAMGLPGPGATEYKEEIEAAALHVPVIASLFGSTPSEFVEVLEAVDSPHVKAFEMNVSCPHAKGYGADIGQDPKQVIEFTQAVKDATSKPVWVKLTPNVTSIVDIGRAAQDGGADAVVAINTLKAMAIDVYAERPILTTKFGGYSGPGVRPVGVRMVYELSGALDIPVIGVGGIRTGRDAIEYMLAGASALQVGSAVYYDGPGVFSRIAEEMYHILQLKGCSNVEEVIGRARQ